ncbi:hypothetical protein PCANC_08675 [Puccinia coronata f. sp. avenae]|uniref:BED-type domain-containing protein n=1 Tax=Puccinia coronata f. sp. avenae TaxID=200324 RepID=A0A2N5T5Z6_9BASI|nr:hypothetical protein PCANC_08675 [Puccinia coronata f. sp. avenae]
MATKKKTEKKRLTRRAPAPARLSEDSSTSSALASSAPPESPPLTSQSQKPSGPSSSIPVDIDSDDPDPASTPIPKSTQLKRKRTKKEDPPEKTAATTSTGTTCKSDSDHPDKKRKTTSDVWDHFTTQGAGEKLKAICSYCKTVMSGKSLSGTNHLRRHVKQCQNFTSHNKQTLLSFSKDSASSEPPWNFCQKTSRDLLMQMIIADENPFRSVEKPIFRKFIASLQPKFKLYGRMTVKSDVMAMFSSMKSDFATELSQAHRIALTTDLWTSSNQNSYMVITAHFLTLDWKLVKRIISFKILPSPHTGFAISEQLIAIMLEWKIQNKVSFITVDNASSNDFAVKRLQAVLLKDPADSALDLDGQFFHI